MTGPYENPIDLAAYLMVVILVLIGWAASTRGPLRYGLWTLITLLFGALMRTAAQSAWIGFLVACGCLWLCGGVQLRKQLLIVAGVGTAVALGVLFSTGELRPAVTLIDKGAADRVVMWKAAIGMIHDRPMLGHGLNTFMANYLTYWVGGERMPRYAHNCYLQMAAETGLIGLTAFLTLLTVLSWQLFRHLRQRIGEQRIILSGFLAGLVAFMVQAALDTNFYSLRQAALFWVLAGLALGFAGRSIHEARSPVEE